MDYKKCISCGRCSQICPMVNIKMIENKPMPQNRCTCCYRCFSSCPKKAITLIGNKVIEQSVIDKYLNVILQNKE
ncbi:MAG: 4Fe-4S binding protein [Lachnospiraceae bacterium]